jgi:tRNA(Ile)-lysidine synthase
VMADLFYKEGYSIGLAHANFQLRGQDSDLDEALVKDMATQWGVPFFGERFETKKHAIENQLSTQMAARELRYAWFAQLMPGRFTKLATAHHLNDALETTLLNLVRGTGIAGLKGIPLQSEYLIRPLLFASRADLEAYALTHNIPWREDSSNATTDYSRNLIRHKVVPQLAKINPGLLGAYSSSLERWREAHQIILNRAKELIFDQLKTVEKEVSLPLSQLHQEIGLATLLHEWLAPLGFTRNQLVNCAEGIRHRRSGREFYAGEYYLLLDRDYLVLRTGNLEKWPSHPILGTQGSATIGHSAITWDSFAAQDQAWDKEAHHAYLDYDKLRFPLEIRPWQMGDWFVPLGMKGKKKLSDFMIDAKIGLNLKSKVLVVVSGGDIVWVVNHRVDDRYKWTSNTERVFKISFEHV